MGYSPFTELGSIFAFGGVGIHPHILENAQEKNTLHFCSQGIEMKCRRDQGV